jgi:hypothetical protein
MRNGAGVVTSSYYSIALEDVLDGEILVEQSASKSRFFPEKERQTLTDLSTNVASRVAHLRFTFTPIHRS